MTDKVVHMLDLDYPESNRMLCQLTQNTQLNITVHKSRITCLSCNAEAKRREDPSWCAPCRARYRDMDLHHMTITHAEKRQAFSQPRVAPYKPDFQKWAEWQATLGDQKLSGNTINVEYTVEVAFLGVKIFGCKRCGVLVFNKDRHTGFHQTNG